MPRAVAVYDHGVACETSVSAARGLPVTLPPLFLRYPDRSTRPQTTPQFLIFTLWTMPPKRKPESPSLRTVLE
jgi:hypothetical protein